MSEDVRASIEGKLREDYDVLLREVRELRVSLSLFSVKLVSILILIILLHCISFCLFLFYFTRDFYGGFITDRGKYFEISRNPSLNSGDRSQ